MSRFLATRGLRPSWTSEHQQQGGAPFWPPTDESMQETDARTMQLFPPRTDDVSLTPSMSTQERRRSFSSCPIDYMQWLCGPQNGAQYGAPFVEEEWEEDEEDVDALEANEGLIRYENEADVAAAQDVGYEKPLVARLTIQSGKVFVDVQLQLARPKLRNHPDGALEMLMSLAALLFLSTPTYL
ncbi:hypothetical protein ABZP36_016531 [Zizania latifolia]